MTATLTTWTPVQIRVISAHYHGRTLVLSVECEDETHELKMHRCQLEAFCECLSTHVHKWEYDHAGHFIGRTGNAWAKVGPRGIEGFRFSEPT